MKTLTFLAGLVIVSVALFLFVAFFSSVESRYECRGNITSGESEQPATIFIKLEKYRWWVGLWSDSVGSAWVELPNQIVASFTHITDAGDILQFWEEPGTFSGNLSTLSGAVGVSLQPLGLFEGSCTRVQ